MRLRPGSPLLRTLGTKMNYIEIINIKLKDDFLLDLFETFDVDVNYCYDRTHEGMDDEYRCSIPDLGLEFLFDSSQRLITLFMRTVNHDGFNPFTGKDPRDTPFQTGKQAVTFAQNNSIKYKYQEFKKWEK